MMKDEGERMKRNHDRHLMEVNEAAVFKSYFPFSSRHFSFVISYFSSFILHPSSFQNSSFFQTL